MIVFQGNSMRVITLDKGIAELCFDRLDSAINKFDTGTVDELKAATVTIRALPDLTGILVTSAKDTFIVGADIFEFPSTFFAKSVTEVTAIIADQNAAFVAFEDSPVPVVTAINGLALGGGLEMALASDYRVMAHGAQIGVPEVSLGLFPGFGGTVRLARLIGAKGAIEWVASGKPRNAEAAFDAGAVDELVSLDTLRDEALRTLVSAIASGEWKLRRSLRRGPVSKDTDAQHFTAALAGESTRAKNYPAATAAIKLVERCLPMSRDEALRWEHAAFAAITATPTARALVQVFINEQAVKKKAKAHGKMAHKLQRVAVLGAGIMGGGIAYTSAVRGTPVIMKDITGKALDLGMEEAQKLLQRQVGNGRMKSAQAEQVLHSIEPTLDYTSFGAVDAVVEAIVENLSVKKSVLAEVEKELKPDAVIASNTSSLSITEIGGALARPENFVGMHFFNPVPVMPLVEVIKGEKTSEVAAATIANYGVAMGKTPIVVKDCPGFLVNRILMANIAGFLLLIRDGADFRRIDQVMEAFGWPMGPAYLQDVIGMDVGSHVFDLITAGYGNRTKFNFTNALQCLVSHQRFGQKNGRGFYRYEVDTKGRPVKLDDPLTDGLLQEIRREREQAFADEAIIDRIMLPMVIEAALCLEDGVAESAADIDMALVLGVGFPRHFGGPLKYADLIGAKGIVDTARRYAGLGGYYQPTKNLLGMAASGNCFY